MVAWCCALAKNFGFPFLAVFEWISFCSRSMSLTCSWHSSMGLNPHSLLMDSFMDITFPALAIIISSFSLVGILMVLASGLYSGMFHCIAVFLQNFL